MGPVLIVAEPGETNGLRGPAVVCCAYCGRMKTEGGQWRLVSVSLARILEGAPIGTVSHGYCADCVARHASRPTLLTTGVA
jgi:hypothetical protein